MKTPEDEAFDEIAKRQGGFQAKRQAAIDKINADFDEEYIKYRAAFPKEYTAASVLGDQAKYGTSWSKDGERIDPMSVYKEPEYAARAFWEKDGRIGVAVTIVRPDGGVHVLQKTIDPPQPAQEPVAWMGTDIDGNPNKFRLNPFSGAIPLYTTPLQREWVGLTDEDCKGMSAGDKVVAMWANRILKEKNT